MTMTENELTYLKPLTIREASAMNFLAEKERQRLAKKAERRMAKIIDQATREGWEG